MQNNNFRGFSSNSRYSQNMGNAGGFQNSIFNHNQQRNQNNLFISNNNNFNNNNFIQNNNNPIRINPLSSFQGNQGRANSQKKRLYVKLTQEEKGYYSNLFQLVDDQNFGKLKAKDAANFMKKSGLSKDTLKNIYLIASQSSKQFLEKDEFYVALRLIALAQNNMPYNAQAIITNKPLPPLPNFNLKKDFLADDDNLFEMRDDEKVKYKRFFDINKDGNNDNISARKAIQMWRSTGADDNVIKKVADVLKPNETKGFLNLREFQVATHLINLSNKHEIPTVLPHNLRKYLGRPEIENNNNLNVLNMNFNNNNNSNNNNNGILKSNNITDILNNFNFNNGNNMNNCQQLAISYGNNVFGNIPNYNNINNNNINYNNVNNNIMNNNNISNNNNQNELKKTMREIDDLNQKNELLNNQITIAKNKLNNVIKEIDDLQNEQQNIRNLINSMKEKCLSLMSNMNFSVTSSSININNNINNNNINNNNINNNNAMNNININNNNNNDNGINSNDNEKNTNAKKNYNNFNVSLNQSGIGPNKTIIGFNLPQQQSQNENKKEEYHKEDKQKQDLLDIMNKMQFDKYLVPDSTNDNINQNAENKEKINNKDVIDQEPENQNALKNIPTLSDSNKKNANKFDDKLLESQAFEPEKLAKLAMDEIPNPGIDDFNFDQGPVNPYEVASPIENKHFNFDRQSNLSLGSEIKKIDDDNGYPNLDMENAGNNNDKAKVNDSNMFKFEYGGDNKQADKQTKDPFNFNTSVKKEEGDEWDF